MGIQTMASQGNSQHQQQHSHIQPSSSSSSSITRQNSWYSLTLDEVTTHLGDLGKPLGSMDLHELLQNIYTSEKPTRPAGLGASVGGTQISPPLSLQRQASLTLAKALSGKSMDDVWSEIRIGQKKRHEEEEDKGKEREPTMGETTLEDFLVQAGLFAEASSTPQSRHPHRNYGVSPSPSIGASSDRSTSGRKREEPDGYERTVDRRLRRKIKNRESAARSRARKQAYHNELVSKVSRLEEENLKLKNEKEFEETLPSESSHEPKYQLRRTSSASF